MTQTQHIDKYQSVKKTSIIGMALVIVITSKAMFSINIAK